MADTDQALGKVKIWKLCEQGSCLLSVAVQNELPGWMHRALGKSPTEKHCQAVMNITAVGMRSPHNSHEIPS